MLNISTEIWKIEWGMISNQTGDLDWPFQLTVYTWDQEYPDNGMAPRYFHFSTCDKMTSDTRIFIGTGMYKIRTAIKEDPKKTRNETP